MDEKQLYEKAWSEQRKRETTQGSTQRKSLRSRLTTSRYQLVQAFVSGKSGSLLDVGCGRGEIIFGLAEQFTRIYGIDIVERELDILARRANTRPDAKKFSFKSCNLNQRWPLEDGIFDVVTCIAVFEHLFDPYFIVDELTRVLRPGGVLVIEVPNIAYLKYRLHIVSGHFPSTSGDPVGWDGGHLHYFTVDNLCALLRSRKLSITDVSCAGLLAPVRRLWPSLLASDICVLCRKESRP